MLSINVKNTQWYEWLFLIIIVLVIIAVATWVSYDEKVRQHEIKHATVETDAWSEGYAAYSFGKMLKDNPYKTVDPTGNGLWYRIQVGQYKNWQEGYLAHKIEVEQPMRLILK